MKVIVKSDKKYNQLCKRDLFMLGPDSACKVSTYSLKMNDSHVIEVNVPGLDFAIPIISGCLEV